MIDSKLLNELNTILSEDISSAMNREKISFDELSQPFQNRIVLFGAGGLGKKVLQGLRKTGLEALAFADNNPTLRGKNIDGIPVLSPENAAQKYGGDSVFIVTIWKASGTHRLEKTRRQLSDLKCKKVTSFAYLFWKHPTIFLPYYTIGLPHLLLEQKDDIIKAFDLWEDEASRREYLMQIRWRFYLDFDCLPSPVSHTQYFPDNLFQLSEEEVFVDCGAFDGDTIRDIYKKLPEFKGKIIAIEPDPSNIQKLKEYFNTLNRNLKDRIIVIPEAVSTKKQKVRFSAMGSAASAIDSGGTIEVDSTPLDDILWNESPTFIKMDIEGAEYDALNSAVSVIKRNLPILAISVYHEPDHLWKLPLLIRSFSDQYRLFLRPHNEEGWDLVAYAVPESRLYKKCK